MKKRFFVKNLILFLIPLLIPIFILGTFSILITQRNAKEEISKNNMNLLAQSKENVELILSELDSIRQTFDTNSEIIISLKNILRNPSPSIDDYKKLAIIKNFLDAPANSKLYIHSIYVYFTNTKGQFIATTDGLVELGSFYDTVWYSNFTKNLSDKDVWTELRNVKRYAFQKDPYEILTIYKRLYSFGLGASDGVMVINIHQNYIENQIKNLVTLPNQCLLVIDENNKIIFKNRSADYLNDISIKEIIDSSDNNFMYKYNKKNYMITKLDSNRYDWKYISVVSQEDLYRIPNKLSIFTLVLLFISLILGLALSVYFTKRNYNRLLSIITIIDSAESNKELPPLPSRVKDEYSYIMQNILKTFIEQSYLKVQLSERKYKMQAMELLALQSQINPHFLYNTLDTVNWMSIRLIGQPNEISYVLENLADILRYSLTVPSKTVTILDEIKNTKCYIDIQKLRYVDKFDVKWEYKEEVCHIHIIKLLFQPLIENCIYHGIKAKKGTGKIKIKINLLESCLRIVVIDNGLGIPKDKLNEIKRALQEDSKHSDHIGLFNTRKRLMLFCGENFKMNLLSKYHLGTAVYIYIPRTLHNEHTI